MKLLERSAQVLLAATLVVLAGVAVSPVRSFDIFWQLATGRHILDTGIVLRQDLFSLASEVPRWEHCWLHDVLFFLTYKIGGYAGLSILKGGLLLLTAVVLVAVARIRASSWVSVVAVLPAAMLLGRGGWLERPQLWTFLCFALSVLVLEKYILRGGRIILALPVIAMFWANLHAGAVLIFPVLLAYLCGEALRLIGRPSPLQKRRLLVISTATLAVGLATVINPYGTQLLETLISAPSLGADSGVLFQLHNMDWRNTTFQANPFFFYALTATALVVAAGWRRLQPRDLFLLGGLALMGLKLERHTTFFYLGALALLPAYIDDILARARSFSRKLEFAGRGLLLLAALGSIFWFYPSALRENGFFKAGLREWHYPVEAADFVQKHDLPANLYNTYDWGGYLIWALYPEYRVFWDGRQDSAQMFELGYHVMAAQPGWQQLLRRFGVQTVVTKACLIDTGQRYPIVDALAHSADWRLVFADESSMVFVRAQSVAEAWLKKHELPVSRVDATVLSEASLLVTDNPQRYLGWREIYRIHMQRGNHARALEALREYLNRTPVRDPGAERDFVLLSMRLGPHGR